jgi:hypothetical protein
MVPQRVDSKVALITHQLSRQGMTVLVGARDEERGGEAAEALREDSRERRDGAVC